MTSPILLNPAIPQNICVAIVAPGGYAKDQDVVKKGILALEQLGCRVKLYVSDESPYLRFSATDSERVSLLHQAALDPEVHIVMALRGGYGTSRLLDMIDWDILTASNKIYVGYSDITALHLGLLAKKQYMSIAGPMLCSDFGRDNPNFFTQQHFWRLITQARYTISVQTPDDDNPSLAVSGTLWGGNLAILAHLVGTPYFPQIEQGILFIEDINEHPYRVERMLLQLLYSGVLEKQQALILGQFTEYRLSDYDNGYDFAAMLDYLRQKINIPILTQLPFGHTPERISLPVGAQATLVSDPDGYVLTLSHYPTLTN